MKFLPFQAEDLARGVMHDGRVYGLDTGGGKTLCGLADILLQLGWDVAHPNTARPCVPAMELPGDRLTPKQPALIVAPGDLHAQWVEEARDKYHAELYPIANQEEFGKLIRGVTPSGKPVIPAAFYIVSYQQLCQNGVLDFPDLDKKGTDPKALLERMGLPVEWTAGEDGRLARDRASKELPVPDSVCGFYHQRGARYRTEYQKLNICPDTDNLAELKASYDREIQALARWADKKQAAQEERRLGKAFAVLENLVPLTRPSDTLSPSDGERAGVRGSDHSIYHALNSRQQTWVIREFLRVKMSDYQRGTGSSKTYERTADGGWTVVPEAQLAAFELEVDPEAPPPPDRRTIRCVYSPSLAELSWQAFAHVVVDEGEKMQGETTLVGEGVRLMKPLFRLVLAATPIKNRLPQLFRLAWWAAGGLSREHPRFPYPDAAAAREEFAKQFMVSERNLSKEKAARNAGLKVPTSRFTKLTAEVCQVHLLWKMFGPLIQRRLKADFGVPMVARIRKAIRVQMGTEQSRVYQYHLKAQYKDINDMPATGARLQALRAVAADPTSLALEPVPGGATEACPVCSKKTAEEKRSGGEKESGDAIPSAPFPPCSSAKFELDSKTLTAKERCPRCHGAGSLPLPSRSSYGLTPKLTCALTLIQEILDRQEQVVVFSSLLAPLDTLSARLTGAGVRHIVADGRTNPKQRGPLMATFKAGRVSRDSIPVALCGAESTASGHNLHRANNVILIAYTWAANLYKQALDRVHRLTSKKDINVYVILCEGTIDARMESLTDEKQDAAGLVLDGKLLNELPQEVNLAELLASAYTTFDTKAATVDEAHLQEQWPALREGLRAAQTEWDDHLPAHEPTSNTQQPTSNSQPMKKKTTKPVAPAAITTPTRFNPLTVMSAAKPEAPAPAHLPTAVPAAPGVAGLLAALAAATKPTAIAPVPPAAPTPKPVRKLPVESQPEKPAVPVPVRQPAPVVTPAPQPAKPVSPSVPSGTDWRTRFAKYRALADHLSRATADV